MQFTKSDIPKNSILLSVFPYLYLPSECSNSSFLSFLSLLIAFSSSISFLVRSLFMQHYLSGILSVSISLISGLLSSTINCLTSPVIFPLLYTLSIISFGWRSLILAQSAQFYFLIADLN